jgi:autotransporter-associated beta strand protein
MNPFPHVHLPLSALACILPVSGEVIYSNLRNIAIPLTNDGVYLNLFTGASGEFPVAGWHINPTFGGINVFNTDKFQPLRESASPVGTLSRLVAGGLISSSSNFIQSGFGASGDHLESGGTFTAGSEGFIGFSVLDGVNPNYGWMRVVFTGAGTPLIKDWAYNTGGGSLAVGNVIQSSSGYTLDTSTQSFALGSTLTGSNQLVIQGGNSVILSSPHSFTGGTSINAGTLVLNAAGAIVGTSFINIAPGATLDVSATAAAWTLGAGQTLSGSGNIVGDVRISGIHAPGNSPGVQPIGGDVTYESTSIFNWDLAANTNTASGRGSAYDAVNISGNLSVEAGAAFRVIQNPGLNFLDPFWRANRQWTDIFSVDGSQSGWAAKSMVAVFDLDNNPVNVSDYGSFTISGTTLNWSAVPEPTNVVFGLLLAAGLFARRRGRAVSGAPTFRR